MQICDAKSLMKNIIKYVRQGISSVYFKMLIPAVIMFIITFFTDGTYEVLMGYNPLTFLYMVFLNVLPLYILITFIFFVSRRVYVGTFVTAVIYSIMHTINKYKVMFRDDPFKIADITAAKEATNIMQNYKLTMQESLVVMYVLFVLLCVVVFVAERKNFFRIRPKSNIKKELMYRGVGAVLSIVVFLGVYSFVYQSKAAMFPLEYTEDWISVVDRQKRKGLMASFMSSKLVYSLEKPYGYVPDEIDSIYKEYNISYTPKKDDVVYPNVIAIMSEAFFDPQGGSYIKFYPGKNPLANFNRIRSYARHGKIVVPGFGGGTSDTEYEFLTGSNATIVDPGLPPIFKTYFSDDVYSIVHYFKELGYTTHGIHPGHRWFYNRGEVYGWLGFDEFFTKETMPQGLKEVNYYVSDEETTKLIIDDYKKYLEEGNDNGYFNFTVTIQNHGPYMDYKTGRDPVLVRNDMQNETLYNVMNNYMIGLSDADKMIGDLEQFINTVDEPTIIVFFGDHLPYFDEDEAGMKSLGLDVESFEDAGVVRRYSTPYIIFGNKAFYKWEEDNDYKTFSGNGGTMSASFLANEMFSFSHIEKPEFFKFTDIVKQNVRVIRDTAFYIEGDILVRNLNSKNQKLINDYRKLIYYTHNDWKYSQNNLK